MIATIGSFRHNVLDSDISHSCSCGTREGGPHQDITVSHDHHGMSNYWRLSDGLPSQMVSDAQNFLCHYDTSNCQTICTLIVVSSAYLLNLYHKEQSFGKLYYSIRKQLPVNQRAPIVCSVPCIDFARKTNCVSQTINRRVNEYIN